MSILKDSMQIFNHLDAKMRLQYCHMESGWKSGHMTLSVKPPPLYVVSLDPYFTLQSSPFYETSEIIKL
jgi:hypothetical protein